MAGTTWPELIAGRKAKASEVESKFDWLEGSLAPMNSGVTADLTYDLGTSTARWETVWVKNIKSGSADMMFTTLNDNQAIGIRTLAPDTNATLDISGIKPLLIPRITTTQRTAVTPANGMLIYNTSVNQFQKYEGGSWLAMGGIILGVSTRLITTSTATITSATALYDYGGAGRLRSLSFLIVGNTLTAHVVIDGQTMTAIDVMTTSSYRFCNYAPPGTTTFLDFSEGMTSASITTTVIPVMLDINFKSSLQVYMNNKPGAGAITMYLDIEKP